MTFVLIIWLQVLKLWSCVVLQPNLSSRIHKELSCFWMWTGRRAERGWGCPLRTKDRTLLRIGRGTEILEQQRYSSSRHKRCSLRHLQLRDSVSPDIAHRANRSWRSLPVHFGRLIKQLLKLRLNDLVILIFFSDCNLSYSPPGSAHVIFPGVYRWNPFNRWRADFGSHLPDG